MVAFSVANSRMFVVDWFYNVLSYFGTWGPVCGRGDGCRVGVFFVSCCECGPSGYPVRATAALLACPSSRFSNECAIAA